MHFLPAIKFCISPMTDYSFRNTCLFGVEKYVVFRPKIYHLLVSLQTQRHVLYQVDAFACLYS